MSALDALTILTGWWLLGFICACLYVIAWSFRTSRAAYLPLRASLRIAVQVARISVFTLSGIQLAFTGPLALLFLALRDRERRKL